MAWLWFSEECSPVSICTVESQRFSSLLESPELSLPIIIDMFSRGWNCFKGAPFPGLVPTTNSRSSTASSTESIISALLSLSWYLLAVFLASERLNSGLTSLSFVL